ncbi:hypothetical protein ACSHUI_00150 [Bacillus subtilis]|uniref:hypothetical protein n=1 Tax=Bacillus subtilis TaxID=1423 RepID=UPI0025C860FC|nr:hypothetical protein [Bacillus subtilis]GLI90439.1 hypothetical protein ANABIO4_37910 [Bacillus subtilis]
MNSIIDPKEQYNECIEIAKQQIGLLVEDIETAMDNDVKVRSLVLTFANLYYELRKVDERRYKERVLVNSQINAGLMKSITEMNTDLNEGAGDDG